MEQMIRNAITAVDNAKKVVDSAEEARDDMLKPLVWACGIDEYFNITDVDFISTDLCIYIEYNYFRGDSDSECFRIPLELINNENPEQAVKDWHQEKLANKKQIELTSLQTQMQALQKKINDIESLP